MQSQITFKSYSALLCSILAYTVLLFLYMSSVNFYRISNISKRHRVPWGADEIKRLADAVSIERATTTVGKINWREVAKRVGTRDRVQCYQRYTYIDHPGKTGTSRRLWSVEETVQLLKWYANYGSNWRMYLACLPERTPAEIKGKFLSLQRALMSKNSDVWRLDEYAPYRELLQESLCRVPYKRRSLTGYVGAHSYRQLWLVQAFKHNRRPFNSWSLDRNALTFPLSSEDFARRCSGSRKRREGRYFCCLTRCKTF